MFGAFRVAVEPKLAPLDPYDRYYIRVDYGTANPTSMGLWGRAGGVWYRMREYYYNSRKEGRQQTDEEYYAESTQFL